MNPAIKDRLVSDLTALEETLFTLHKDAAGEEFNRLGWVYITLYEARSVLAGKSDPKDHSNAPSTPTQSQQQTPDSTLPPISVGPKRTMLVEIRVSEDFEKRLDNQWEVEREIHADRWKWKWEEDYVEPYKQRIEYLERQNTQQAVEAEAQSQQPPLSPGSGEALRAIMALLMDARNVMQLSANIQDTNRLNKEFARYDLAIGLKRVVGEIDAFLAQPATSSGESDSFPQLIQVTSGAPTDEELQQFDESTLAYWAWKRATFKGEWRMPLAKVAWDAGVKWGSMKISG